MEWQIESRADVEKLNIDSIPEKLNYVSLALKQIHSEVENKTALIGFGGSPWTLATYMIEGGSSKKYSSTSSA